MTAAPPRSATSAGSAIRCGMLAVLACLAAAGAAAPAGGETEAPADLGAWSVAASREGGGCFLTRAYDRAGGTTLLLGLDTDGTNRLSVLNANWSIAPKEKLRLDFRLSGGSYARHPAVGIAADGKQGFVTSFEAKFPGYFASSHELRIFRGKVPVERLELGGSGKAVAALRDCIAARPKMPGSAGRDDDIPEDPFAPEARDSKPRR